MAYFSIGFDHIVSRMGFDHVLFVVVLCAAWPLREWRRVLLLLSGFTAGHSLTLALTALGYVSFPSKVVEPLIMATILIASLLNIARPRPGAIVLPFVMATLFGLVHGCGFAGYFNMMLGDEESIVLPLLGFNLGLEAGQVVVVAAFFALYALLDKAKPIARRDWAIFVSGTGCGLALKMLLEQIA